MLQFIIKIQQDINIDIFLAFDKMPKRVKKGIETPKRMTKNKEVKIYRLVC